MTATSPAMTGSNCVSLALMMRKHDNCFFCKMGLTGYECNRHHLIPRRYHQSRQVSNDERLAVVYVHMDCHKNFHATFDNARWSLDRYREEMNRIHFGKFIYF